MRSFQSLLLVLLICFYPARAGRHVLSVEPYMAEWCAAQFPERIGSLVDGHFMAKMIRDRSYVLVEPYLGQYCFDVFEANHFLKGQNRDKTFQNMRDKSHIQVEPYLMEWGEEVMNHPSYVGEDTKAASNVESYVAKWCVDGHFHKLIKNKKMRQEAIA